jgi:hypothetical protein
VCNQGWSKSITLAKECRERNIPVILAFTGGLYPSLSSSISPLFDVARYYVYALDLGEHHEYLDVKDNKQLDIPLTNVIERIISIHSPPLILPPPNSRLSPTNFT